MRIVSRIVTYFSEPPFSLGTQDMKRLAEKYAIWNTSLFCPLNVSIRINRMMMGWLTHEETHRDHQEQQAYFLYR